MMGMWHRMRRFAAGCVERQHACVCVCARPEWERKRPEWSRMKHDGVYMHIRTYIYICIYLHVDYFNQSSQVSMCVRTYVMYFLVAPQS